MSSEKAAIDTDSLESQLVRASGIKRFINYVIDLAIFYIIGIGIMVFIMSSSTDNSIDSGDSPLMERFVALILYGLYMSLVETLFKGKSVGKFVTGTRAVNLDGSPINNSKAFARGFSRAVPFCVFSALGNPCDPWQDRWTDTMVIDEKKSDSLVK